jgi:hypothetical protein
MDCVGDLFSVAPLNLDRCDPPEPEGPLSLTRPGTYELDTDTGILSHPFEADRTLVHNVVFQAGSSELFVTTVTNFELGTLSDLELSGSRPLVLLSTSAISVAGDLRATASGALSGAGGDLDVNCFFYGRGADGNTQEDDESGDEAGSGGGGGGFDGVGGRGAKVDGSEDDDTLGGAPSGSTNLVPLRGGCAGGAGGFNGGLGGGAGGAIQLVAAGDFTLSGRISASGGGGRGVQGAGGGGGGGGSGGGVLLQANTLTQSGIITVNGGGGGEGSRSSVFTDNGNNGAASLNTPASGGQGLSSGGNGGMGGVPGEAATNGQQGSSSSINAAGGGGGGGAPGRIRIEVANP